MRTTSTKPKRWPNAIAQRTIALAVIAATAGGCGKPSYQLETAPVRGTVTLDGEPLSSGYVIVPTARGRMASGAIQPDGTFVMSTYEEGDGVQVGKHPVIVHEVPPDEFATMPQDRRVRIPQRYSSAGTSGLTIEVQSGQENTLQLDLTTQENHTLPRT